MLETDVWQIPFAGGATDCLTLLFVMQEMVAVLPVRSVSCALVLILAHFNFAS